MKILKLVITSLLIFIGFVIINKLINYEESKLELPQDIPQYEETIKAYKKANRDMLLQTFYLKEGNKGAKAFINGYDVLKHLLLAGFFGYVFSSLYKKELEELKAKKESR